ncbi:MAG: sensor histidine kinase [Bacteroidota bacterium]
MKIFAPLHAKILFGYAVLGLLFVAFVANSLIQFDFLRTTLEKHREILAFFDELRDARRLEKNFLLYEKPADLHDALDKANAATLIFAGIARSSSEVSGDEANLIGDYRDRLQELLQAPEHNAGNEALLQAIYLSGGHALKLGERLDAASQQAVQEAIQHHEQNLRRTIWVSLLLGLVVGVLVTRSAVRPLREIEKKLAKVAKGETGRIEGQETGGEVASLTRSINETLQELEIRQTSLARSSRLMALGTMLSGVAHELNNPLSNISSSGQILQEEWRELPAAEVQRLLNQIDDQVLRAKRIVSALLNGPERSELQITRENVSHLLAEALALLRTGIPEGVGISVALDPKIEAFVDRPRFQQVLINVIRNAVDAVGQQGAIAIRAWREEFPEGYGTTFEVEDNGAGIPDHLASRIFDPFFTTKPAGQGVGLGLYIAHEIVAEHGGTITAEAGAQGGTRVWIHLPDPPAALGSQA